MDLVSILLYCFMSCAIGAVLMLLVQYYAFVRYFNIPSMDEGNDDEHQKRENEKYVLPDNLLLNLKTPDAESKNTLMAINLILQFLYFELRHSNAVRKWFYRKLSLELDELLLKTTTGKLFDKLTIRDLDLGSQFPEIKNLKVHHADLDDNEGHIENLDLLLDLYYKGNFRLAIDADMVLGKKGFLSVKVKHISGLARLQFTRRPYTHWSLSFVGDPQLELDVETQFQGRQVQSNVTTLISNQIRKAIRRKHTLPNYKLRYKPFFNRPEDEVDTSDIVVNGSLDVQISELTRLVVPNGVTGVFCTVTLASVAWVRARQHGDNQLKVSLDLEIHKAKNQQIGIVFKQVDNTVIVESIIPYSPASKAKMRPGDILVSIEGKTLTHISNVAKIVKNLSMPVFKLRIERTVRGVIKSHASPIEDFELTQDITAETNIQYNKSSENVKIGSQAGGTTVLKRANSAEAAKRSDSSESSQANTPSNSPRKITDKPVAASGRLKSFSRNNSDSKVLDEIEEVAATSEDADFVFPQYTTADCEPSAFIRMNHSLDFELRETFQFVNINVFGRGAKQQPACLLGYLNLPLPVVLAECAESNLGHFLKRYPLNPPNTPNLSNHHLSTQSGFDPNSCYGDILLSFVWNENLTATTEVIKKQKLVDKSSASKAGLEKEDAGAQKSHDFIRTHFHRATTCDFCGKKIWLKDAVQCRNCVMCCHKKCITKCQNATVCLPADGSSQSGATGQQVEFKLTEAPDIDDEIDDGDQDDEQLGPKLEVHRQSFSDLLAQGLKRVNSANNLALPMGVLGHCSKSLPPSPQHTPRVNPFVLVTQILEAIPDDVREIGREKIVELTEPLVDWGSPDDLMGLAKASSKHLFAELEAGERLEKINRQLSKIHVAMNCETNCQSSLQASPAKEPAKSSAASKNPSASNNTIVGGDLVLQTKPPVISAGKDIGPKGTADQLLTPDQQQMATARKALLIGESEARLQSLSVIMLYLCNGLQHAQMLQTD